MRTDSSASNDDVGNEMAERSVTGIRPVEGKNRLTETADLDVTACHGCLSPDNRLNIALPELVQGELPRKSVEFAATS